MNHKSSNPETVSAFASIPEHVFTAGLPGNEVALLDMESGYYFYLNEVGSTMFKLLQVRKDLEAVLEDLIKEYEGVDRGKLRTDLCKLVDELLSTGLLKVSQATSS